jgi:hypothetical protein
MLQAFNTVLSRGGIKGFYQGLIPWAWIEASTKGAVLLFASGEIETMAKEKFGLGGAGAGLLGGMGGGIAQAYATMGMSVYGMLLGMDQRNSYNHPLSSFRHFRR